MTGDLRERLTEEEGPVYIARCPEHGLHGERQECFVCGGPVEQVPMVPPQAGAVAVFGNTETRKHGNRARS